MYKFVLAVMSLTLLLPVQSSALDANNLTQEEQTMLRNNCKSAQRTMQRIQYVDPVARVNRGIAYNNVTKLMSAMTARAAFNAYSIPQFSIETEAVQNLRAQFAEDYTDYEIALRDLINFDCTENPKEFYERLVDVRAKRAIITLRIREIDRRLDVYAASVTQLGELIEAKDIGR
ncbi:MAG: hypothetical protein ABIQ64_04030 [Candidatus Saccharimonadales bacterium]